MLTPLILIAILGCTIINTAIALTSEPSAPVRILWALVIGLALAINVLKQEKNSG